MANPLVHSLNLRPLNPSDIDDMMIWASDARVMRVHPHGPCTTKAQALDLLHNFILPHPWYRAICINNLPIGSIGVKPSPSPPGEEHGRKASIGYDLAFDYWGRGIATAAVKIAVAQVFKEWTQLERIEALVEVENIGSQRVLEKAGFVKEGVLRKYFVLNGESVNAIMFSFLSSDFSSFG